MAIAPVIQSNRWSRSFGSANSAFGIEFARTILSFLKKYWHNYDVILLHSSIACTKQNWQKQHLWSPIGAFAWCTFPSGMVNWKVPTFWCLRQLKDSWEYNADGFLLKRHWLSNFELNFLHSALHSVAATSNSIFYTQWLPTHIYISLVIFLWVATSLKKHHEKSFR